MYTPILYSYTLAFLNYLYFTRILGTENLFVCFYTSFKPFLDCHTFTNSLTFVVFLHMCLLSPVGKYQG